MTGQPFSTRRKPKDRDFIETREGLFFCVVDYLHPPDKITAYLKYSPASSGLWQRGGTAYHRELAFYHAHQVALTLDELEKRYPHYVHNCPVRDLRFSMVPHGDIRRYYCPETRLAEVLAGPKDILEEELARVTGALRQQAGIPGEDLGVTGSILLGIHNPEISDIDVILYGGENARRLRQALNERALEGFSPMSAAYEAEWRQGVIRNFGLTGRQAAWLISRRWNFACFGEGSHVVSLHPARRDAEIRETYGEHLYREAGVACIQATIARADEAVFLPAVYGVEQVHFLEGTPVELEEIHTYEGLFGQIGEPGLRVEARGKLEKIDAGPLHRLVVGSSRRLGPEYLLPMGL